MEETSGGILRRVVAEPIKGTASWGPLLVLKEKYFTSLPNGKVIPQNLFLNFFSHVSNNWNTVILNKNFMDWFCSLSIYLQKLFPIFTWFCTFTLKHLYFFREYVWKMSQNFCKSSKKYRTFIFFNFIQYTLKSGCWGKAFFICKPGGLI